MVGMKLWFPDDKMAPSGDMLKLGLKWGLKWLKFQIIGMSRLRGFESETRLKPSSQRMDWQRV